MRISDKYRERPSRLVEDVGFGAGLLIATAFAGVELVIRMGVRLGPCGEDTHFPWWFVIVIGVLVAPKMLGKGTAGKGWEGLIGLLPGAG